MLETESKQLYNSHILYQRMNIICLICFILNIHRQNTS